MAKSKVLIKHKKGRPTWQYKFDYMDHYLATPIEYKDTEKSYKEALTWATNQLHEKNNTKPILFKNFVENFYVPDKCEWLADKIADGKFISPVVLRDRQTQIKLFILPFFKNYSLPQITVALIKAFKVHLTKIKSERYNRLLSTQYISHVLNNLSIIMDWAVVKGLIQFNPVKLAGKPNIVHERRGILTREELIKIFPNDIDEMIKIWGRFEYALIAFLLADTGARRSEIVALQWKHINLDLGYIVIEQALKADKKTIGKPKANKSRASAIRKRAITLLKYYKSITVYQTNKDDFLFKGKSEKNKTLYPNTITRVIRSVFTKNLDNVKERNLCAHSFRHTAVSERRRIEDADALKYQIGHSQDKTQDGYDEFTPKQIIETYIKQGKAKANED